MLFTALATLVIAVPLVPLIQRDLRRAQFWARVDRKIQIMQERYVRLGVAAAKASKAIQEFGETLKKVNEHR